MQATVFDFTFKLRDRAREFYIKKAVVPIVSQGFRVIAIKREPKSFRVRSAVVSEGVTQDEYDNFINANGSPYTGGIGVWGSIFALSLDEGFIPSKKILIRRSYYDDILVGRMVSNKGFLRTDRIFLVRRSYLPIHVLGPTTKNLGSKDVPNSVALYYDVPPKYSYLNSLRAFGIKSEGKVIHLSISMSRRCLGGDYVPKERIVEKMSFKGLKSDSIEMTVFRTSRSFNGIKKYNYVRFVTEVFGFSIDGSRYKYAILSLNKNLLHNLSTKSKKQRILVNI